MKVTVTPPSSGQLGVNAERFRLALQAAQIDLGLVYAAIKLAGRIADNPELVLLKDGVTADEGVILEAIKVLSDQGVLTESWLFSIQKGLLDTVTAAEQLEILNTFFRTWVESVQATDVIALNLGKGLLDGIQAQELIALGVIKSIQDAVNSVEFISLDSQKPLQDVALASDLIQLNTTGNKFDSAVATSSGRLLMQNYGQADYFAEDYTGTTRELQ